MGEENEFKNRINELHFDLVKADISHSFDIHSPLFSVRCSYQSTKNPLPASSTVGGSFI